MRHLYRSSLLIGFLAIGAGLVSAEDKTVRSGSGDSIPLEAVDTPNTDVLDPATYALNFRFYSNGGITNRLVIGPLNRVNLGIYFDTQGIIGTGDPHLVRPSLFFKWRMYDGSDVLPALAIGYDNQGYLYQRTSKEFLHKEKGFYLVASHEIFLPTFVLHGGVNINDFDNTDVFGFAGGTLQVTDAFDLIVEYDNIRDLPNNRFNAMGRFHVTPFFYIDFGARNIGRKSDKGAERIVRLNYSAHFPF